MSEDSILIVCLAAVWVAYIIAGAFGGKDE